MIARAHHLHDDRLFDCYLAERAGDAADIPASEHLLECEECAARYAELARFMDTVRAEGEAEADEIFTPERLWNQHQDIMRKVDHVGRAARVLSFPGKVGRHMMGATTRVAPRWLAAAAAAGLFVGVAVGGTFFDAGFHVNSSAETSQAEPIVLARSKPMRTPATLPPVRVTSRASVVEPEPAAAPTAVDDDMFLLELEDALEHPRTRELMPFDALTPHVRDVRNQLR